MSKKAPDVISVLPLAGPGVAHGGAPGDGAALTTEITVDTCVTLSWRASNAEGAASNSVRIELFRYKDNHGALFLDVVSKRATEGTWQWVVPEQYACSDRLFFVIRSRRRKAAHVMATSELFNVVECGGRGGEHGGERDMRLKGAAAAAASDHQVDSADATPRRSSDTLTSYVGSRTAAYVAPGPTKPTLPQHRKRNRALSAVGEVGAGWMVVSCNKRAVVLLHRPSSMVSPIATFRGRMPVLAGGKLVTGSAYYRQRLAYFEVEVLHSYGAKAKLVIGWAGDDHPLDGVSLGECASSVGHCSDDGAMVSGLVGEAHPYYNNSNQTGESSGVMSSDDGGSGGGGGGGGSVGSLRAQGGHSIASPRDGRTAAAMFSQEWSDADIVGCGLDCKSGEVFFTLNGNLLALPFRLGPELLLTGSETARESMPSRSSSNVSVWPAFSAASSAKVRLRVERRLKFDGFAEVLQSLEQRAPRNTFRKSLRSSSNNNIPSSESDRSSSNSLGTSTRAESELTARPASSASPPPPRAPATRQTLSTNPPSPPPEEEAPSSVSVTTIPTASPNAESAASGAPIPPLAPPSQPSPSRASALPPPNEQAQANNAKSISLWSESDVLEWITSFRGLRRYANSFEDLGVDGSMLAQVTDDDLKSDLGVSVRLHRVKILDAVKRLALEESLRISRQHIIRRDAPVAKTESSRSRAPTISSSFPYDDDVAASASSFNHHGSMYSSLDTHSVDSRNSSINNLQLYETKPTSAAATGIGNSGSTSPAASGVVYNSPAEEATIVVLFSCPLVDEARRPVPLLAHDMERQLICASLRTAKRSLSVRMSHASTDSLCAAVTMGCRVLHYSGHADPHSLSFEDSNGLLHRLDVERLKDLFGRRIGGGRQRQQSANSMASNGGSNSSSSSSRFCGAAAMAAGHVPAATAAAVAVAAAGTAPGATTAVIPNTISNATSIPPLVFVSACHSQAAGEAFLAAGAEHVVAVERDERIEDSAAHAFTRSFYLALAVGHSVESSFQIGQTAVSAVPGKSKRDAMADAEKFVLLPAGGAHDVKLFEDIPLNGFLEPPPMVSDIVPSPPEGFTGRQVEIHGIIQQLKLHRTVSVVGPKGIGKSATAIMVANYMSERSLFNDGILFLRSQYDDDFESLSNLVLDEWVNCKLRAEERKRVSQQHHRGGLVAVSSNGSGGGVFNTGRASSTGNAISEEYQYQSELHEVLVRLSTADCLIVIDQAGGGVGDFVRTVCERTRSVRFLLTSTLRSLANEHSVELGPLNAADAAIMFLRRLPRSNLAEFFRDEIQEVWDAAFGGEEDQARLRGHHQGGLRGKRVMLERVLEKNGVLTPSDVLRVCSLMRDPHGKRLQEALGVVCGELAQQSAAALKGGGAREVG
jgi:hypothetical protein